MEKAQIKKYLKDLKTINDLPVSKRYQELALKSYPFDLQLLTASALYRRSRKLYNTLGGRFEPRVISTMRSLSSQDIFKDEIQYSPSGEEFAWFADHSAEVHDPAAEIEALYRFNEISVFHEQNHRIIWRVLPPAPTDQRDVSRYLNFAESMVVTLDLALGDELGKEISNVLERLRLIYRPGGQDKWSAEGKKNYRHYLLAVLTATYYLLERVDTRDILKALDYVFPDQKKLNKEAFRRSLELSELFTQNTNPQWQSRFWKEAQARLEEMHVDSEEPILLMPEDPLDLDSEFFFAHRLFDLFEI